MPVPIVRSAVDVAGQRRANLGVGLTELLVALVIFSTALLGIVGTAARVGGIVNSSHVRLKAGAVAQQKIEELLTAPFDSVKDGTTVRDDVKLEWVVKESTRAKQIVLAYSYDVPGRTRSDTLTAAVLKP
jgi:type II secretory pathway pseudopilin PulG